jgi:hypothetical protein
MKIIQQVLHLPSNIFKVSSLQRKVTFPISLFKHRPYQISTIFPRQELMEGPSLISQQLNDLLSSFNRKGGHVAKQP